MKSRICKIIGRTCSRISGTGRKKHRHKGNAERFPLSAAMRRAKGEWRMKRDLKKQIMTALAVTALLGAVSPAVQAAATASVIPVGRDPVIAADGEKSVSAAAEKTKITLTESSKNTIYGGGAAYAHMENTDSHGEIYTAKMTTAGADIHVNQDVSGTADAGLFTNFAVFGGGSAAAANWANASSDMTDTVNVNIRANVNGMVVGGGLAYFYGSVDGGKYDLQGTASASAGDTNINMQSGRVKGIIGGGVALDDSQADRINAAAKTTGTASINVAGGTVSKLQIENIGRAGSSEQQDPWKNNHYQDGINAAAGNAAIAAGGIALGGGAEAYVAKAVVNISGGTVEGDVYGGGIAAYGARGTSIELRSDPDKYNYNGGSYVEDSVMNLTGGTIKGNVYAGGAAAEKDSAGSPVYGGYDEAEAAVGTSTINLAGAAVTGILSGQGTLDKTASDDEKVRVGTSTLNIIGTNHLSIKESDTSKIQSFDAVNFKAGSETVLDKSFTTDKHLIDGGKVTVENGARLNIAQLDKEASGAYQIAVNTDKESTFWTDDNLIYDRTGGYYAAGQKGTNGEFDITYSKIDTSDAKTVEKAAAGMANALGARSLLGMFREGMSSSWEGFGAAKDYLKDWSEAEDPTAGRKGMLFGEDAAVTGNTVSIARAVADNVTQRLSFTDDYVQEQGWANQDGGVWAKYMHRKYETDGMGSSMGSIRSGTDYDGVLIGMDFAERGKFRSGAAIHYGSGEGSGLISRNDYDAWGITLYGSLKDEEAGTNLLADIGWMTGSNHIDGIVNGTRMSADRDVDVWTVGLRGEKEFVSGRNQIVPYAGLRYMSVNPGSYTTYYGGKEAFHNDAENQDLWLLPIGVSFRNETATSSGWKITLKLDLSYIWAFGDTDTDMTVNAGNASSTLYYDVMDDSSWLATLGVEAEKDAWTFGINYGYQKGDDTRTRTWYVTAGYSF